MRRPHEIITEQYRIVQADSRQLLKQLPDKSVDLILTDPPYNLSNYSTGNMKFGWRKDINNDLADWDKIDFNPEEWVDDFVRLLKPTGNLVAFTSYNLLGKWHQAFDPIFDTFQFVVWHKTNPVPKFRKAGFLNSCELIICAWNKGHTWNFGAQNEMHNFIEAPICMGKERIKGEAAHPTQKPLRVLSHLIEIASQPGQIVLDPFMGVGSTGEAALRAGRKFLGVEIDKRYYHASHERLSALDKKGATEAKSPNVMEDYAEDSRPPVFLAA
jgi:site-specific DNA-methyltransferase (adenine-specific)/modification methylase